MRLIFAVLFMALLIIIGLTTGQLRVVQASEISAKIQNGELINYSYVEIKGDLNISAPRVILSPIKIYNSTVSGSVKLNGNILNNSVQIDRTIFMGPVDFINCQFKEPAEFIGSQFNDNSVFSYSKFGNGADFTSTKFNKSVSFKNTNFEHSSLFFNAKFKGIASYEFASFLNGSFFDSAIFFDSVIFRNAHFDDARFLACDFEGNVNFDSAKFDNSAIFTSSNFDKKLYLTGIDFKKLSINWEDIKYALSADGQTYLLLIKNFKDNEQFEDADNCYYQYRDKKRQNMPFSWGKISEYISWLSCGYGVRWQHTIISAIAAVIMFGIYYEFYYIKGIMINSFLKQQSDTPYKYGFIYNLKKSLSFSAMTLLSLPGEWSRYGKDEYAKFVADHWFSTIFERLIGWGLLLLLIGTVSRLMVRY